MVYVYMVIWKPNKKCKVISCDSFAQAQGLCCYHHGRTEFSADKYLPKKMNRGKRSTKVNCNRNNFVYGNESAHLFLLSTIENPVPDDIEAIPSKKSRKDNMKYVGVS